MEDKNETATLTSEEAEKLLKDVMDKVLENLKSMEIREYCIDAKGHVVDREKSLKISITTFNLRSQNKFKK